MAKKGSQLTSADRESSPGWKLLYGSGTDPDTTEVGIIGKMRHANAGFTGIGATSMNAIDKLKSWPQLPAVDVTVEAVGGRSRKVHPSPPMIISYLVTWTFYVQATDYHDARFDLDYYLQKTRHLIQNANNSSDANFYDFGVTSFIYFIDDSNIIADQPIPFRLPNGAKAMTASIRVRIDVTTTQ